MKKIFIILGLIMIPYAAAEEAAVQQPAQNPLTVSQQIMFDNCTKIFGINQEKLFYLTLASISANRNKYLATISKVDKTNAILKITPCNNVYNFPPGIITNTFKYIDLNMTTKI